jgi:agmatine deiminase
MVIDIETNKLYFSSLIKAEKYAPLWDELERILLRYGYKPSFIEGTRDIWCRDYMPVQIDENKFSQFKYFPDYCVDHKHIKLLTIQEEMQYKQPRKAQIRQIDLIVDGGNIVKSKNKAIMTEKVFAENKNREKNPSLKCLKKH